MKYRPILLSLVAVTFLCVSIQGRSGPATGSISPDRATDKCVIDLANVQPCTLSMKNDDRVVWVNNSASDVYVCANPVQDPFEAYAWKVPPSDKRKSGKIRDAATPGTYMFYQSTSACTVPPTRDKQRTNPQIIIQP